MSEYRREFRQAEREAYWTAPRVIFGLLALIVVVGAAGWTISLLSQPGRIVSKTFDADNIIQNYEWYHDANNQVKARVAQVNGHKAIIRDNADAGERSRLRIELAAIQQSCRDLVGRYNANATKTNRSIFMGREAPAFLEPQICE